MPVSTNWNPAFEALPNKVETTKQIGLNRRIYPVSAAFIRAKSKAAGGWGSYGPCGVHPHPVNAERVFPAESSGAVPGVVSTGIYLASRFIIAASRILKKKRQSRFRIARLMHS
jgi:hypothetical protein